MRKFVFAAGLAALVLLTACGGRKTERLIVASETWTCYGVVKQDCMLIKRHGNDPWELFYGVIEGFDYEPGYEYVLRVYTDKVENPPADAPGIVYTLKKVVSKELKNSKGFPVFEELFEEIEHEPEP